jgi:hypothetical protein
MLLCAVANPAAGQTLAAATSGLFDATEPPLELTLTTDLKAVVKERGKEHPYHRAVLGYVDSSGAPAALDIRVRTRGIFRLKPTTCSFPPLQLDLPKKAAAHTPFGARDKLKLVTYCRNRDEYEQYVVQEYLIYRVYNLLTERSFRVRLARVTYADSAGREQPVTRYGFVLEDDRELATRVHATLVEQQGLLQQDIDPENMGLVGVFQYFIANTDWSVWGLHNVKLLRDSSSALYAVPYDFDWSGVIGTVYARPDARLPIQSVRQRLFRGACRTPEELAAVFARFQEKKEAIYALYRDEPALAPKTRDQALRYYDEFYKTIADPGAIKREFLQKCGNQT